jgi:hypothetical protein
VLAADDHGFGTACSQANQKLSHGNYQLTSDCDAAFYCASNSTCAHKGCRNQDFPFGYAQGAELPPECPSGQFCPDEGDACQPQLAVDSPCQLNRDDECAPPDASLNLSGPRNTNGSICLNFKCTWANVTSGSTCIVENMPYIAYDQSGGTEYINIVSRDNCKNGLFCDAASHQCKSQLDIGASCTADKECRTQNCELSGVCGMLLSTTRHVATWVYVVVGVAILAAIVGVLVGLYFLHRKSRDAEQQKRAQYWREQDAYRSNILSMREQARVATMPTLNWQDSGSSRGGYRDDYGPAGGFAAPKTSSGLRNNISDSDDDSRRNSMEEALVPTLDDQDDFNSRRRKKSVRV